MQLRTLGNSGTLVPVWCLGTMTFGDEADEPAARAILDHYVDAGGASSTPPTCTRGARRRRSSAGGWPTAATATS